MVPWVTSSIFATRAVPIQSPLVWLSACSTASKSNSAKAAASSAVRSIRTATGRRPGAATTGVGVLTLTDHRDPVATAWSLNAARNLSAALGGVEPPNPPQLITLTLQSLCSAVN